MHFLNVRVGYSAYEMGEEGVRMSSLGRELVFLILQFLGEEKLKESVHKLERESGLFFNMKYFEDEVHNGNWDKAEEYLSGFTKIDDNENSRRIFFGMRKQKYLEALDKHDRPKAVEILTNDLKVFATSDEDLFKEMTELLTLGDIRENEKLRMYGDTKSARAIMLVTLKMHIVTNPLFRDKLQFPNVKKSRLQHLINQSLNWQHLHCKNPQANPDIKTIFVDHSCPSPSINQLLGSIPKTVVRTLNVGSSPMSMDFHPVQECLLLVGTSVGEIALWEVGSMERLVSRNFKDPGVRVNRVIWSPDGALFGVAYSRQFVQIYSYHGGDQIRQHLVIVAHASGVNDVAFSHPKEQLCFITCGDDKTIKVWDAASGAMHYNLEGHEAPVFSVCPHCRENIHFLFSTSIDGKIKAWLYDDSGSRVDYQTPCGAFTTLGYSGDGTRLFSCETSQDWRSSLAEWDEIEGSVKRTYQGLRKRSYGIMQFDTTKNRVLAAGHDFCIKFWDMDNAQLLTTVYADGRLPANPLIRFNKNGTLLAVSANDNGIKILANADGIRFLPTLDNSLYHASTSGASESLED